MAQDFHAAFGLGESDTGISSIDTGGVALAAIQALNRKLDHQNQALTSQNAMLAHMNQVLSAENDALERRLARLEAVVNQPQSNTFALNPGH